MELMDGTEIFSCFLTGKEAKVLMKAYRLAKKGKRNPRSI